MNGRPLVSLSRKRRSTASDGQVVIILAIAMFALIGFVALSIDTGFLMAERRQAQSAADAGALAAATDVLRNKSLDVVQNAGKAYGAENAEVTAGEVVINWPPASGEYAGNKKYVEAIVTKDVDKFFIGAVYDGDWKVTARAVAGVEPYPRPYALLALNAPGIYINGSTSVYVEGGSAMSNSNIGSSGNSNIFFAGGSIDAAGSIAGNSNWQASGGLNPNSSPVPDPLKDTAAPSGSAQTAPDCKTTCTFKPGRYTNQNITIQGTATFDPGVYIFDGSTTLTLQNTNSWIKGTGVMFYFSGNATFNPGNGNMQISAQDTSTNAGAKAIALWIANCKTYDNSGNGVFTVEGIIYAPCSHVVLHGTPGGIGVQVIVGDLEIKGTSEFRIKYREFVNMDKPKVWLTE